MEVQDLQALYVECRNNPNYQYRNATDEQMLEMATRSFEKMPPAQQEKAQLSWAKEFMAAGIPASKEIGDQLLLFRFMAQTNLFFLCKLLEKYDQVTLYTHEEICNKFFVQKNPAFASFEQFANQYTDLKDRMLLVPRGGFKSSIDIADAIQWLICFPAITILILTGVYNLAGDFVGELKQHFTLEESGIPDPKTGKSLLTPRKLQNRITRAWSSSMFQVLFPEHCISPREGTQFEFQTPATVSDGREPSVRAASIEQALSGMHFGVMKLDDVVTNENSRTLDRMIKINQQISINRAMLNPFGFFDVIGTWYDEKDYYGLKIKQEEQFAKDNGMLESIIGSVDSGRFACGQEMKIYLRSAWWLTEEAKKAGKIEAEAVESDWELRFPERLPYNFLYRENKTDPEGFAVKYLNNPRQIGKVKFPRELLVRRTIPGNQLPQQGIIVTTVDTAYSTKSWADYTVIITALIYGGRFYIVNMNRGHYNEYELPAIIADVAKNWKPKRIAIEDSTGVKWMSRELRREMDKRGISVPVEFVPLGQGSKANSKKMKAKPVVRLLGDERMFFLNSCENLNDLYSELEKFTGTSSDAHDDVVSGLSLLAEVFGPYADMESRVSQAGTDFVSDQKARARHDQIYGLNRFAKYNANVSNVNPTENPVTAFQMENSRLFRDDTDIDPLSELM